MYFDLQEGMDRTKLCIPRKGNQRCCEQKGYKVKNKAGK